MKFHQYIISFLMKDYHHKRLLIVEQTVKQLLINGHTDKLTQVTSVICMSGT